MDSSIENILGGTMDEASFDKLSSINNSHITRLIAEYATLCNPEKVIVCDDSAEDIAFIRQQALNLHEECSIGLEGQTVHFDGYYDQARDKANTKYLVPEGVSLGENINSVEKNRGIDEIRDIMENIMSGHTMYVRFFCLGPVNSLFSILAMQLTDSPYVAHSEDILYRPGYEEFRKLGDSNDFFRIIHSEGAVDEQYTSINIDKRRIYIDLDANTIYSANTQYAGNTVGLKKLSMRLAINKSAQEGWLTEHMFVMGAHGPGGRTTYLTGAYPSACGKTATSMLTGETIIGDDIAYLRIVDGTIRAVNVEKGIFGIIRDVNSDNDPLLYEVLTSPGETIFSNVLIDEDNRPYWLGKDGICPEKGINHSGEWHKGKKDTDGNEITPSHPNARYTIPLERLNNLDPLWDDPAGVPVGGVIYGGRDSDTSVPVEQSFNWDHGIITKGATLESETTSATLGREGVRKFNLMSILDFLAYPLGEYIQNNLDFGHSSDSPPCIFGVNYFLKNQEGNYITAMDDKRVWIKWIERRIHNELEAVETPTGLIPQYKDLNMLFLETLDREYSRDAYKEQFTVRVQENLAKIDRVLQIYDNAPSTPDIFFETIDKQKERLLKAAEKHGDYIEPGVCAG